MEINSEIAKSVKKNVNNVLVQMKINAYNVKIIKLYMKDNAL